MHLDKLFSLKVCTSLHSLKWYLGDPFPHTVIISFNLCQFNSPDTASHYHLNFQLRFNLEMNLFPLIQKGLQKSCETLGSL